MDNNIYVTKAVLPSMEEYIAEISPLWESHWLTNMGVKHKELQKKKKEFLFNYWHNFIFSALDKCGVYFPRFEELTSIKEIGDKDSKWYKAITEIQDQLHPVNLEKEFSKEEEIIAKNALIAIEELNLWKNKKAVRRR